MDLGKITPTYLTLDMFDKSFDSKSKGNTPAIIFLDIKKAFDTVDHKVMIEKLKFYGADGTVILWIKNYLSDGANCNLYTPKSENLKNVYYLGAKAWNCLPSDLRNLTDSRYLVKTSKIAY